MKSGFNDKGAGIHEVKSIKKVILKKSNKSGNPKTRPARAQKDGQNRE